MLTLEVTKNYEGTGTLLLSFDNGNIAGNLLPNEPEEEGSYIASGSYSSAQSIQFVLDSASTAQSRATIGAILKDLAKCKEATCADQVLRSLMIWMSLDPPECEGRPWLSMRELNYLTGGFAVSDEAIPFLDEAVPLWPEILDWWRSDIHLDGTPWVGFNGFQWDRPRIPPRPQHLGRPPEHKGPEAFGILVAKLEQIEAAMVNQIKVDNVSAVRQALGGLRLQGEAHRVKGRPGDKAGDPPYTYDPVKEREGAPQEGGDTWVATQIILTADDMSVNPFEGVWGALQVQSL